MIAIEVFDQGHDVEVERGDQRLDLTLSRQKVDHLLYRACPVHVERDRDQLGAYRLDEEVALLVRAVLQQLLREVVAKGVCQSRGVS